MRCWRRWQFGRGLRLAKVVIETDRLPHPKVRPNSRSHWREKAKWVAYERQYMCDLIIALRLTEGLSGPMERAHVTYEYWNPRGLDFDNFLASCKSWQDAIVEMAILRDDSPEHLSGTVKPWNKCARGEERVRIEIEEVAE